MILGDEVIIDVSFTYEIGDTGFHTGRTLETIEDCKAEVRAELEAIDPHEFFMEVRK
jgi:hypothetical protein